jgi:hypothetical protein
VSSTVGASFGNLSDLNRSYSSYFIVVRRFLAFTQMAYAVYANQT